MSQLQPKGSIDQSAPSQQEGQAASPISPNKLPETAKYPNPCGKGQTHQDSELCAQWTAAVAGRDSAHWAERTYNVEVVGAVAVGVSLFFSALAAILALMAYRSTKRAEVAQTRAYLFPETTFLADGSHHEIEGDYEMVPAAIITIKNYGSTPARDVRHWAAVVITPNVEDVTLPEPDMSKAAPTFCAPGAVLTFIRRVVSEARDQQSIYCFTDAMVGEIRAAQTAIVVYGRVAYTDIFGKKRTTNYRLGYSGKWPPPPNMSMTYSSYGNTDD